MITVKGLTKNFGPFTAVRNIDFSVTKKSGITALLGPNGAGKTTTLRMLTGYLNPSAGEISVNGTVLGNEDSRITIKRQIGYLPETTPLYPEMLISEYLEFMGKVHGLKEAQLEASAREMIEKLELGSHLYSPIGILSKGFRQRVGLAGALIHKPAVVILDEPTSGLDPNQISHIRTLIKTLGKESLMILSTHILQEVEDICQRVIIINQGQIVADEPIEKLRAFHTCELIARGKGIQEKLQTFPLVRKCTVDKNIARAPEGYARYDCELNEDSPQKLFALFAGCGWEVREFRPQARSLQAIFEELTRKP